MKVEKWTTGVENGMVFVYRDDVLVLIMNKEKWELFKAEIEEKERSK